MRLGKLLSAGEVTEAAGLAEAAGPEPAAAAVAPPVRAEATLPDGHREAPAAAEAGR